MTCPSSMHETGYSKPVHWDNPEGGDGEGVGGGVQDGVEVCCQVGGGTCTLMADSCQCMAKTTIIL